jgi:integrase
MPDSALANIQPLPDFADSLLAITPTPLDQNPAVIYLASLSEGSRPSMRQALNTIAGLLGIAKRHNNLGHDVRYLDVPWAALRARHTVTIHAQLLKLHSPAIANKLLAGLRRVLREARQRGQISADDYDSTTDLKTIRAERHPRGRIVTDAEIATLLRSCASDSSPAGARDAAIIALLQSTGLRRAEAAALDLADYDAGNGGITIQRGKGHETQRILIQGRARAALDTWIAIRGNEEGPLFYGVVKGGRLVARRLAGQAMAVICAHRAAEAMVPPLTPHDLRRTFFSRQLGIDATMARTPHRAEREDSVVIR